jgi:glycosyltransferase involved in cell wall biosynthesis
VQTTRFLLSQFSFLLTRMIRVLHPITRLIIGGAQENTMLTAQLMNHADPYKGRYQVDVVSGPQTGPEGSLIEEVRARDVHLTIMPELLREISPVNDLKAMINLRRMIRGNDGKPAYDIVHTHSSKAGVLGRLAAKWAGVPIIVHTVHGWSFHDKMSPRKKAMYVLLEKMGDAVGDAMIVVSPNDIEKGVTEGISKPERYALIRSGIEMERFGHPQVPRDEMRRQLGIPADAMVVGSVTRLSAQKAPLDLVATFGKIYRVQPSVYFVIVGDGSLRKEVEVALRQEGIFERTILTGLRRDVPELMATFDVFVLTSLWEGLPRVLPQAMATGLPIVCTQADGSAEAVTEGINGYLVERGNTSGMAARVISLLKDDDMRNRFGEAGRQRVPEFSVTTMVAEIDRLYTRLLKEKGIV